MVGVTRRPRRLSQARNGLPLSPPREPWRDQTRAVVHVLQRKRRGSPLSSLVSLSSRAARVAWWRETCNLASWRPGGYDRHLSGVTSQPDPRSETAEILASRWRPRGSECSVLATNGIIPSTGLGHFWAFQLLPEGWRGWGILRVRRSPGRGKGRAGGMGGRAGLEGGNPWYSRPVTKR